MKIKMLKLAAGPDRPPMEKGRVYEVPDKVAEVFIEAGAAEVFVPKPKKPATDSPDPGSDQDSDPNPDPKKKDKKKSKKKSKKKASKNGDGS